MNLGMQELILIFIVALLVFGPRKLPELGQSLGKGLREFRRATNEMKATWSDQMRDAENEVRNTAGDLRKMGQDIRRDVEAPPPSHRPNASVASGEATSGQATSGEDASAEGSSAPGPSDSRDSSDAAASRARSEDAPGSASEPVGQASGDASPAGESDRESSTPS
jgi:sec-independent protein translocase protein TatA